MMSKLPLYTCALGLLCSPGVFANRYGSVPITRDYQSDKASVTLKQKIGDLEKEFGVSIIINSEISGELLVENKNKVGSIEDALVQLAGENNLKFRKIKKGVYVISTKKTTKETGRSNDPLLNSAVAATKLGASSVLNDVIVSGTIKGTDGEPVVGATIAVKGTTTGVMTDANGAFSLKLGEGTYTLTASLVGYETVTTTVTVNGKDPVTIGFEMNEARVGLNEVVVVGNRRTDRTAIQSAAPIDIIDTKDIISKFPQMDVGQLLQMVAPSFNANRQSTADGADHVDPASLRGLGPDQTLVLINGKRRHNTALINIYSNRGVGNVGTDLNAIPVSAIDRIEILRDGAAAQYGSDAIAGVINIVLKKNDAAGMAALNGSITQKGDGETGEFFLNKGFKLTERGYLNLTGEFSHRGPTNRAATNNIAASDPAFSFDSATEQYKVDSAGGYGKYKPQYGDSRVDNGRFFYNMGIKSRNEKLEFYSFGGLSYKSGKSAALRRNPVSGDPNETSSPAVVLALYPDGFIPYINTSVVDVSATVGLKADIGLWKSDFYNTFGRNSMTYNVTNSNNASMGINSPTSFYCGGYAFNQNVTGLNFSRLFKQTLQGVNVAFGAEFRIDNYTITAGDSASWKDYGQGLPDAAGGSQGFQGFTPENAINKSRTNIGGWIDIDADVTKKLTIGVAARVENYSDFGGTLNGKFSARYQVAPQLAIRGAVSSGFRAPSLQQIYFSNSLTNVVAGNFVRQGIYSNNSDAARALGIPALKPEKSLNYSVGLVFTPVNNLVITADAYLIYIHDRVILTGYFGSDTTNPAYNSVLNSLGISSAAFFTNSVNTETKGLDIVATYTIKAGKCSFLPSFAANFTSTKVTDVAASSSLLSQYTDTYLDLRQRSLLESGAPKYKYIFSLTFNAGKFTATSRTILYGSLFYYNWATDYAPMTFQPQVTTDLSVGYNITKKLNLSAGVNNLLNQYPNNTRQAYLASLADPTTASNYLPYDWDSKAPYEAVQQGFSGRMFFAKVNYKF